MKLSGWYKKTSFLLPLGIFLISFIVYGVTSARTLVNIADSDELLTAAYGSGVAHPPSYPLYTAFLYLILKLPESWNPVFLVHLSSGLFQSIALVFFFLTSVVLTKRKDVSIIGTLALAFSQLFWNQATYAEVFSLMFFFIALLVWMIVSKKNLAWISLLFGIAASHHQLAVTLVPGIVWMYAKKHRVPWVLCIGLFSIGFSVPYFWIHIANHQAPLSWLVNPGFMGFIDVLLRSIYSGTPTLAVSWLHRLYSIATLLVHTFSSFNWIISFAALVGIITSRKLVVPVQRFLLSSLIFSGPVLMAYLVFLDPKTISLEMHAYNTFLTLRMTLIFQYIFALFVPLGMTWILNINRIKKYKLIEICFLILTFGSIIFSMIKTYSLVNKHSNFFDEKFYTEVLHFLPINSVLLVDSDDAFGLLAAQTIRSTRQDVLIIPTVMQMRWGYLQQYLPHHIFAVNGYYRLILSLTEWAEINGKELFVYQPKKIFVQQLTAYHYMFSPYGYTLKISRKVEPSPSYSYESSQQLIAGSYSKNDLWSIFERKQLANMHEILGMAYAQNGSAEQSKIQQTLSKQLIDSISLEK